MSKLAESSIDKFEHGEEYEKFVSRMTLGDISSLEGKYLTPEVSNAYDTIYYYLLDNEELREKFVKEINDE